MRSYGIILVSFLILLAIHELEPKATSANIFTYDQAGYYNYLPALFIHQDLGFQPNPDQDFTNIQKHRDGHDVAVNRYGTGVAILLAPFFGMAYLQSAFFDSEQTGFSAAYRGWVFVGHFFYLIIGLLLLRHILNRYFEDNLTAWTILILVLGSNLSYYVVYEPLMSHNYSFFLFSLSLYLGIRWLEHKKTKDLLFLGLSFGLLVNTRVPNIIFGLVLLLWEVNSWETLKARWQLILKNWIIIGSTALLFFVTFIPLLLYWHQTTGYWFINSYGKTQGTFFFSDPMIGEILWGYKKGWLVYSPLMFFSILGLFFLYQQLSNIFWGIFLYTLLNWYIVSTWWCWWYGGSFGMRALIESMLPLSFALASFLHWAFQNKWKQIPISLLIIGGLGLNVLQSYQYAHNCIHDFGMTKNAYWTVFGKIPPLSPEDYKKYRRTLLGVYMNNMTVEEREQTKTYNKRSEKQ